MFAAVAFCTKLIYALYSIMAKKHQVNKLSRVFCVCAFQWCRRHSFQFTHAVWDSILTNAATFLSKIVPSVAVLLFCKNKQVNN